MFQLRAVVTRALPDKTPLPHRIKVIDAARPHWGDCSGPRKAWQAARRDYLVRYGDRPRTKALTERERPEAEML